MKKFFLLIWFAALMQFSCTSSQKSEPILEANASQQKSLTGQSGVQDEISNPNIVQVALGSKDHTTLVAALKAASLVDAMSNAGPFTVFAPTNAAFEKLPKGTVDDLLKPENKEKLADILQYHVSLGVFTEEMLEDGRSLGQANSQNVKIS